MTEMQAIELAKKFAAPANATRSEMLTKVHILGNHIYATDGAIAIRIGHGGVHGFETLLERNNVANFIDAILDQDWVGPEPLDVEELMEMATNIYTRRLQQFGSAIDAKMLYAKTNFKVCPHCGAKVYQWEDRLLTADGLEKLQTREERGWLIPVRLILANYQAINLDARYLKMALEATGPSAKVYTRDYHTNHIQLRRMIRFHHKNINVIVMGLNPNDDNRPRYNMSTINVLRPHPIRQGGAK